MKRKITDELLDLVDENDKIIGTVERSRANSDPRLIHREIGILIYDKDRRVLFQQRAKGKSDPGLWIISCAGHVPAGMEPIEAAKMELLEELGLRLKLKFIGKYLISAESQTVFVYPYYAKYDELQPIKLDRREASQAKFLTESQVDEMIKGGEKFEDDSLNAAREFWKK